MAADTNSRAASASVPIRFARPFPKSSKFGISVTGGTLSAALSDTLSRLLHLSQDNNKCYCGEGSAFPRRSMNKCYFDGVQDKMPWEVRSRAPNLSVTFAFFASL